METKRPGFVHIKTNELKEMFINKAENKLSANSVSEKNNNLAFYTCKEFAANIDGTLRCWRQKWIVTIIEKIMTDDDDDDGPNDWQTDQQTVLLSMIRYLYHQRDRFPLIFM